MKKILLIALLGPVALLGLTACGPEPLTDEERQALVAAALQAIGDLEAQNINYVEASPEIKSHIFAACTVTQLALAASADLESVQKINAACTVLRRAAE